MSTVTVSYEQWWPRDAWVSDMDTVAEMIWWEQPALAWLREQGIEPALRLKSDSGSMPYDSQPHGDIFDADTRIYTISFNLPTDIYTWMMLQWPEQRTRIEFDD